MKQYLTETNFIISYQDLQNLRGLYLPIIGYKSAALFQSLSDETQINKYKVDYRNIKDILMLLKFNKHDFIESRKILEAVGLLKTFTKSTGELQLFSLYKPLNIEKFKKNPILWLKLKNTIGDVGLERLIFKNKTEIIDKTNFTDISVKYQDIFDINEKQQITYKKEMITPKFINKAEAIISLSAEMFFRYISNIKPSPTLLALFLKLRDKSLSNRSINFIQDYSYQLNKKVVAKHIEIIALDFLKKDIASSNDIQKELKNALLSKKKQKIEQTPTKTAKGGEMSLDEVFSDLFS